MGASTSLLRAVAIVPIEGSCVARCPLISPTARCFVLTEAAGMRLLGLVGGPQEAGPDGDGETCRARELSIIDGSEELMSRPRGYLPRLLSFLAADEGSDEELLPHARACILARRPSLLYLFAADEGSDEELHPPRPRLLALIKAYKVPEEEILPRPRPYLLAPRPHQLCLAADSASSSEIPSRPRAVYLPAVCSFGDEVEWSFQNAAIRQRALAGSIQMAPTRTFSATATVSSSSFATGPGARPHFFQPAIRTGYGPPGHYLFRPAGRPNSLRSQMMGRRNWCWTPWQPRNPNALPSKPPGFEDILKMMDARKLTEEEKGRLKEFLMQKLYAEDEVPEAHEVKLDLILHVVKKNDKGISDLWAQAENKPKKWKKITLIMTWISFIMTIFR